MKKIIILFLVAVIVTSCGVYQTVDINRLTTGMTKAQVVNMFGSPQRVLAANQTRDGYQEVLEYRTYRDEIYALIFWDDYLTGYEFLYDDITYVPAPAPPIMFPPRGRPLPPIYYNPGTPAPPRPNPPGRPQPAPPSERPERPTQPTQPGRPQPAPPSENPGRPGNNSPGNNTKPATPPSENPRPSTRPTESTQPSTRPTTRPAETTRPSSGSQSTRSTGSSSRTSGSQNNESGRSSRSGR